MSDQNEVNPFLSVTFETQSVTGFVVSSTEFEFGLAGYDSFPLFPKAKVAYFVLAECRRNSIGAHPVHPNTDWTNRIQQKEKISQFWIRCELLEEGIQYPHKQEQMLQ